MEQFLSIYAIFFTVVGLMACMSLYVENPKRDYECAIVYLLCALLSNYYWGAYTVLMGGENPDVSSFMAYLGWNLGYFPLILMHFNRRKIEGKRFFSPLCLLPVPLNIWQFTLYIQFGGLFTNIWESFFATVCICLCINRMLFYLKERKNGMPFPYESLAIFSLFTIEYIMWTASCFDWPSMWLDPYNYACFLQGIAYIALPLAVAAECGGLHRKNTASGLAHLARFIRPFYIGLVITCCLGGYFLGTWMKDTIGNSLTSPDEANPYIMIAIVLFVFSIILIIFSMTIIVIVRLAKKAAESDELRKAKDIADHSNAAKSDFLANMSHEIRTPINVILGMNEMILREGISSRDDLPGERSLIRKSFADICNFAGNIESAGTNLLSIINDILDFSKIEAGKLEIVEGNYKLSSVLNDLCNVIAFKAKDKGLKFDVDVDSSLPDDLYGDEVRMRQVVTNILNNAVKYTKEGSVHMSVNGKRADDLKVGEAVYLEIKISDTGIGIREEDIDRLFTKFERMDLKTNSTVEGTGLGLAITKSLLTMMGGSIEVESEYGKGSVFTVILPQTVMSSEALGDFKTKYEQSMLERKAYEESFHAPEARILIVDDTLMNLTVAKGLLKDTQIVIDTAQSGMLSIKMASETKYDIILMDQRMPEMDGTEAMHRILEDETGPNVQTPFICLTADAVSGARERYLAEGFADYLTKPIDSMALEKMLVRYLPSEKILLGKGKKNGEVPENDDEAYSRLEEAGIDTSTGLMHCQNDGAFYRTILEEYVSGASEKRSDLDKYFEQKNWKDYSILVHSLKSTSKMIGAEDLYETAAALEKASDEKDEKTLVLEHAGMMERYSQLITIISDAMDISPQNTTSDDGDVLEFMPE